MENDNKPEITCVLLNPSIDHIYEIDNFHPGGTFIAKVVKTFPVGKAVSVSLALSTLGEDPRVIAFVGKDDFELYQDFLDLHGINRVFLVPVDSNTREHLTFVDRVRKTTTHIRQSQFRVKKVHVDCLKDLLRMLSAGNEQFVVFAGSLPEGLNLDDHEALIGICKKQGNKVMIDTSGSGLKHVMKIQKPYLLKINHVELEYLLEKRDNVIEQDSDYFNLSRENLNRIVEDAKSLLDDDLKFVAITLGDKGGVIVTEKQAFHAITFVNDVLNTVGSGDAFFAGLIHGIARGLDLGETIKIASAAGAANTLRHGAGIFIKVDFNRLLKKTKITRLVP
ncbi:MAG: 1-phosphofructokinase family hexose kinase [Promethearchaeota archaeon]